MLDRPFLELGRVFLLLDFLQPLPPKSKVNCTSPLEDYLSGEPQTSPEGISVGMWCVTGNMLQEVFVSAV